MPGSAGSGGAGGKVGDRRAAAARPGRARPGRLGVMTTTLWEYPSQHYVSATTGKQVVGTRGYEGATPSWVVWQLLTRYTRRGDVVVDPMCGGGTTIDVAADLGRRGIGFDVSPSREDIEKADARGLPLDDSSADFVFVDPPYSTHIVYSDDPSCIGKLDAGGEDGGEAYYDAMAGVLGECVRVLRDRRYMAVYVSDSWKKQRGAKGKGTFMPIGFELFGMLARAVKPVDIVCVVRGNAKLKKGNWHKSAEEGNYFLRGFNYLMIFKKEG